MKRARRRPWGRWTARTALALGAVSLLGLGAATVVTERRFASRGLGPTRPLPTVEGPDAVARGARLARERCTGCHAEDLGGQVLADGLVVGTVVGPNLTRGGGLSSDAWARAFRDGSRLTASDVAAILAYARACDPIDRALPSPRLGPLGRARLLLGTASDDHADAR